MVRFTHPCLYSTTVSPASIFLANLKTAMSGRPHGPYTVKNLAQQQVVHDQYNSLTLTALLLEAVKGGE